MTDKLLTDIADYVLNTSVGSEEAYATARLCLMDSLCCAMMALRYPACTKLLGPIVPGAAMPPGSGARVPGTRDELDPVQAAWNFGAMVRWLDYNDTWLAAEWGHPSDNLGAILPLTDYLCAQGKNLPGVLADYLCAQGKKLPGVRDVLAAMIQAHEIQGVLALTHGFNRVGLDHVLLVRIASTAVATRLLGGTREQIVNAVSNAWIDGGALRTYRHHPNTGSRKSWAAGDAASRAVRLALIALRGEMGYATALTAKGWGFQDVLFKGQPIALAQPLGSYVMEHVLFKISFPAEFHAQTAVECATRLHPAVRDRLDEIERIDIHTQESAIRIIDKIGPLKNPADRDHCIQYMVAIPLIHGELTADHYEDAAAADPRVDALREKMRVIEDPGYTRDYLDPRKRSIGNAVQVFFRDGSATQKVEVEYPVGHRRRRAEGVPLLRAKFEAAIATRFDAEQCGRIYAAFADDATLDAMSVRDFVSLFVAD